MDLIMRYFGEVNWHDIIFSELSIVLILIVVWVLLAVVRALLRRLEATLIARGQALGEVPGESTKRAETLVRLLRQGVVILIWLMALLLI